MKSRSLMLTVAVAVLGTAGAATAATPLVIAGGGGGSGYYATNGGGGQTVASGGAGYGPGGGAGGVNGSGGGGGTGYGGTYNGGGGAGWIGAGTAGQGLYPSPGVYGAAGQGGASAPTFAGGLGGNINGETANGGYGGGGGGGWQGGGGGGGYSGGGGGDGSDDGAGGGGSYLAPGAILLNAIAGANGVDDSDQGSTVGNNGSVTINGVTFSYTGSLQTYVVPTSGLYDITAVGAQGGGSSSGAIGGYGALIEGDDYLTAGTSLNILVGGAGNYGNFGGVWGGGGGGGSFVFTSSVPEPATWGMMILGLGLAGLALRQRKVVSAA